MRLVCYKISDAAPEIRPAPARRSWMEDWHGGLAYRCLPLVIANSCGWQILNPVPFIASWNGSEGMGGVKVLSLDEHKKPIALSHFGYGTLTFAFDCLFRTEPGVQLWVSGPINQFKDAVQPLTGVVETEWLPFTFTANWVFTRVNKPVAFEADEPICTIFPISLGSLESVVPEIDNLKNNRELYEEYETWRASRYAFNAVAPQLRERGKDWQRHYYRGQTHSGRKYAAHRTKIELKTFELCGTSSSSNRQE